MGALGPKLRWATAMAFCVLLAVALTPIVVLAIAPGKGAGPVNLGRPLSRIGSNGWRVRAAVRRRLVCLMTPLRRTVSVFGLFPDRLKLASETIVGKEKWEKAKEEIASRKDAKETPDQDDFVPTINLLLIAICRPPI